MIFAAEVKTIGNARGRRPDYGAEIRSVVFPILKRVFRARPPYNGKSGRLVAENGNTWQA
jgi:hypothetical protein